MLNSLNLINQIKNGDLSVLKSKENKWLLYLYLTKEKNLNIERVSSINEIQANSVLNYVENTLKVLNDVDCSQDIKNIVEQVLIWCEVAKCGLPHQRQEWINNGFNLLIHNIGSAQIYANHKKINISDIVETKEDYLIYVLIKTHGLIGQYIRGEINLYENQELTNLISKGFINKDYLTEILKVLNLCIIKGVSEKLWDKIKDEVFNIINNIVLNKYDNTYSLKERIKRLRGISINKGENIDEAYNIISSNKKIEDIFEFIFSKTNLWYVESALVDFKFEEFIKIFLICYKNCNPLLLNHISFEQLMKDIYYDYQGKKSINLYKKRIIEKYLSEISFDDILNKNISYNEHVNYKITEKQNNTISLTFEFSPAGLKLIEFCGEAEKSSIYGKGILLLYDLFGFRKDKYDRFHNEETYLETMNQSINHKAVIADYVVGDKIVDIGPGGGALMDIIVEKKPEAKVLGLDISTNAVEELNRKKFKEGKTWNVLQADVININKYIDNIQKHFESEKVSSFVFSSIIHEIFSYNELNGKKFNYESIEKVLKNTFNLLEIGGRIIIRDGIMTEPKEQYRIIKFKDKKDIHWLNRYVNEFKGRQVNYEKIDDTSVKMKINDAMEFLYTFTWGPDSFDHEIQEQFGYFTPSEFKNFIKETLGETAKIIEFKHYLQEGYEEHLAEKIEFFNEDLERISLPDSTCFIVIEKQ